MSAINRMQLKLDQLSADSERAQQWSRDLEQRLLATLNSTSWRVTWPLRKVGAVVRRAGAVPVRAKTKGLMRRAAVRITGSERMRRLLIPVTLRFPGLGRHLNKAMNAIKQEPAVVPANAAALAPDIPELPAEIKALPASARRVMADLQRVLSVNDGS